MTCSMQGLGSSSELIRMAVELTASLLPCWEQCDRSRKDGTESLLEPSVAPYYRRWGRGKQGRCFNCAILIWAETLKCFVIYF